MLTKTPLASTCEALAGVLSYPTDGYPALVADCLRRLKAEGGPALREIERFAASVEKMPVEAMEEIYTRTFDMAPVCVPYVTTYIWGDESFERGKLMSGLAEAYERLGFASGGELPDHIALMLRFISSLDEAETEDLIEYCLTRPVKEMVERLESADNLYAPVMRAVSMVIARETTEGKSGD